MPQFTNTKDILGGLLNLYGKAVKAPFESGAEAGQMLLDNNAITMLGSLLGKASAIPAEQELRNNTEGTQSRLKQMGLENTDPLADATLKELIKIRKEQVREAAQSGVPLEQIRQQAESMASATQGTRNLLNQQLPQGQQAVAGPDGGIIVGKTEQPTPEAIQSNPQDEATQILQALTQQGQPQQQQAQQQGQPQEISDSGVPRAELSQATNPIMRFLNAFIGKDTRALQKEARLLQNELLRQQVEGTQPLQEGERKLQELKGKQAESLALIKETFSGDISDAEKQQQTRQAFQNDIINLVDAWDNLGLGKGAVGGRLGGLMAGTLGQITGTGREARARFDSIQSGLQYTIAEYITGQSGRALSDKDIERISKLAKFKPSMKAEDFRGKLQGVLDFANSKISAQGGTPTITSAEQLINSSKGNKQQSSGNWTQEKESRYQELLKKQRGE